MESWNELKANWHLQKISFAAKGHGDISFSWFWQIYVEGLCHGNLLEEEAIALSDVFRKSLPVQPLPIEMRHKEQVICLPSRANFVRDVHAKNKSETNSVVEVRWKIT